MNVAVIGASESKEKYSRKAFDLLRENGHSVFPVHPSLNEIDGHKVFRSIGEIGVPLDTVTMYVGKAVSMQMAESIIQKKPRRIIFNPGSENEALEHAAQAAGIETMRACTLVLLRTMQF